MIVPATLNLIAQRNSVFTEPLQLQRNGAPFNLGPTGPYGEQIRCDMQIDASAGDGNPVLTLSSTPNANTSRVYVIDEATGKLFIRIANADILSIPPNTNPAKPAIFNYDIVVTFTGGDFYNLVGGTFTLQEGVTTTHG